LGGQAQTRFSEFDFRETPVGTGGAVSPGNDGVFTEKVRSQVRMWVGDWEREREYVGARNAAPVRVSSWLTTA